VDEESVRGLSSRNFPWFSHYHGFLSRPCARQTPIWLALFISSFFLVLTLKQYLRWSNPGCISDFLRGRLRSTILHWESKSWPSFFHTNFFSRSRADVTWRLRKQNRGLILILKPGFVACYNPVKRISLQVIKDLYQLSWGLGFLDFLRVGSYARRPSSSKFLQTKIMGNDGCSADIEMS
jgi:hypothetical protein